MATTAGQTKDLGDVLHVLEQVGQTLLQGFQVFGAQLTLGHAAVVFQCLDSGHDDHSAGVKAGSTALDVQKLLRTQICTEASLGDHIIGQLHAGVGGGDRVAAVGDVGEGAAVDDGGVVLQGLHQVGLDGVLEQDGHGAFRLQVMGGDRLTVHGCSPR